jgi:hypothetical protein
VTTTIIVRKVGKLANRIILFAHLIAAAQEHGFRVLNPAFDEYAMYFEHFRHSPWASYPTRAVRVPAALAGSTRHLVYGFARVTMRLLTAVNVRNSFIDFVRVDEVDEFYDLGSEQFLDLVASRHIIAIEGWGLRDNRSFRKHAHNVRPLFAPARDIRQAVDATISRARRRGGILIGVHVRRGDYRTFQDGSFFYEWPEYRAIMEHIVALFPEQDVAFLICSDEDVRLDVFHGMAVERGHGLHVADLYSLAGCDYLVGPPSSFSLWASFYGRRPLYWMRKVSARPTLDDFAVRFPGEHFDH